MRFGIYVVPNQPWPELERRWHLVEELGFDSVWGCNDLYWPETRGGICFDGLVVLAAMAARTTRVRIGTLMLSLPIRDNPAVLAKEIIALDHLANGRLEVGFGAGILEGDHTGAGHEVWGKGRTGRTVPGGGGDRRPSHPRGGRVLRGPLLQDHRPVDVARTRPAAEATARGGWAATEAEAFKRTVERSHRLDDFCIEVGRDPASIARSFLVFESTGNYEVTPPTRASSSEEAFRDLVGRYAEIGMSELIFYFPEPEEPCRAREDRRRVARAARVMSGSDIRRPAAAASLTMCPEAGLCCLTAER